MKIEQLKAVIDDIALNHPGINIQFNFKNYIISDFSFYDSISINKDGKMYSGTFVITENKDDFNDE